MICIICGTESESKFCPNCGAPLDILNYKTCHVCGEKGRHEFCKNCGTPFEDAEFKTCRVCGAKGKHLFCKYCGTPFENIEYRTCPECGAKGKYAFCKYCGTPLITEPQIYRRNSPLDKRRIFQLSGIAALVVLAVTAGTVWMTIGKSVFAPVSQYASPRSSSVNAHTYESSESSESSQESVPSQPPSSAQASQAPSSAPASSAVATPPVTSQAPAPAADVFVPDYAPGQANTIGNTAGNVINMGLAALQGNWIYFRDINQNFGLYKIKTDGSGKSRLGQNLQVGNCICVEGDWIYFAFNQEIDKVKTDGTGKQKIYGDQAQNLQVIGDWIYYINVGDNQTIYKIKTDGTYRKQLNHSRSSFLNIVDGYIYYRNDGLGSTVYKITTDGSEEQQVVNSSVYNLLYDGNEFYCRGAEGLYKTTIDQKSTQKISDESPYYYNISGDWIYCSNWSSNGSDGRIYRINKNDGSGKQFLNSVNSTNINIVGNWIYYQNVADGQTVYKMYIDGSQQQKVA